MRTVDLNMREGEGHGRAGAAGGGAAAAAAAVSASSTTSSLPPQTTPAPVTFLILGAGWTSTFLLPLLATHNISHAATSRSGRGNTIPFTFDPDRTDLALYRTLPRATYILITFPLLGAAQANTLTEAYCHAHGLLSSSSASPSLSPPSQPSAQPPPHLPHWIQLGTSSIFSAPTWNTHHSPYTATPRSLAEDALLDPDAASRTGAAVVLNLAGLYGGERQPREWVTRVAKSKEEVRAKGALHLVHGEDVARGVLRVCGLLERNSENGNKADAVQGRFPAGRRYLVTDLHVYDWWDLFQAWDTQELRKRSSEGLQGGVAMVVVDKGKGTLSAAEAEKLAYARWVAELLVEDDVRALPRGVDRLGRVLDGRAFWRDIGLEPVMGRVV